MNYRSITVATLLSMTLAGCAQDRDSDSNEGVPFDFSEQMKSVPSSTEQGEKYREAYRFSLNGCDTGKHEFSSSSAEELKRQLCEALQDFDLNRGCAEFSRRNFFEKRCSGYEWTAD